MTRSVRTLREIFERACELESGERVRFLDEACSGSASLRHEVEAMLAADATGGGRLESSSAPGIVDALTRLRPENLAGRKVAGYRLEELLAIGGSGAVFVATQDRPRRRVALKVTRTDVLSPEARARFLHEAEILGLLTHPNVARVYASGIEEVGGSPLAYLAVEYVEGAQDIVAFARTSRLSRSQRLELFARLCDAVQHGHQKGVVHRDLKPGNVLVDGGGHLRVIDFGIARLLSATDGERLTMDGSVLGTLTYMSPEQCRTDGHVDTRTDVYALGVMLYELLTDRLPHDFSGVSLLEAAQALQVDEPPAPSRIAPGMSEDLDRVVGKAMAKDPDLRYATAAALGNDVRAYLRGEPVAAHPPSALYTMRRFVGRHRITVALTAALALLLVAFSVYAALEATRFRRQRDRAAREAHKFERSTDFFASLLSTANPKTGTAGKSVVEVLDEMIPQVSDVVGDEPEVEAHVRGLIALKLLELGRYEESERERRRALELYEGIPDASLADRVGAHNALAIVLLERSGLEEAGKVLADARKLLEGVGKEFDLQRAETLYLTAGLEVLEGNPATGRTIMQEALAIYEDVGNVAGVIECLEDLVVMASGRGDSERAVVLAREAFDRGRAHYAEGDERRVFCGMYLTWALEKRRAAGDLAEAERLQREMLAELEAIFEKETFYEVVWRRSLARFVFEQGRYEEGLTEARRALATALELYGPNHAEVARTRRALAKLEERHGLRDDARQNWAEALKILRASFPEDHYEVVEARERLEALEG